MVNLCKCGHKFHKDWCHYVDKVTGKACKCYQPVVPEPLTIFSPDLRGKVPEQMVRCPKWQECENTIDCNGHDIPHVKWEDCGIVCFPHKGSCMKAPACVPVPSASPDLCDGCGFLNCELRAPMVKECAFAEIGHNSPASKPDGVSAFELRYGKPEPASQNPYKGLKCVALELPCNCSVPESAWQEGYDACKKAMEGEVIEWRNNFYSLQKADQEVINERDAKIKAMSALQNAYEEYIKLLGEELNDLVGLASAHGWRSSRFEAGKELREKIAKLKKQSELEVEK